MQQETTTFAAFIGIDWAYRKHDFVVHVPGKDKREKGILEHRPPVIDAWAQKLRERFGGAPIAIAIELSRGPLVSALLDHDIFVVFPVNPAMLAKYRLAFTPSRAKDDPTEAEIALELLLRHPEKVPPLRRESPDMRTLQRMVEDRRSLVEDRVSLTNRLTNALKAYFPQAVAWFPDKETAVFADFLERWPALDDAQRAREKTLLDFFHEHNVRRPSAIEERIAKIRAEQPLTTDNAVIAPARLLVQALVPQLRAVCQAIARFDAEIDRVCGRLADYHLFRALPGAGPVFAARLLAAFGECRERFPTAEALQCYAGVAPVTERSGNKNWVHWRWSCPTFLRQTFVEWVGQTIPRSFWAGTFYARQKGERSFPRCRHSSPRLQVDSDSPSLLGRPTALRRIAIAFRPAKTQLAVAQVCGSRGSLIFLAVPSGCELGGPLQGTKRFIVRAGIKVGCPEELALRRHLAILAIWQRAPSASPSSRTT